MGDPGILSGHNKCEMLLSIAQGRTIQEFCHLLLRDLRASTKGPSDSRPSDCEAMYQGLHEVHTTGPWHEQVERLIQWHVGGRHSVSEAAEGFSFSSLSRSEIGGQRGPSHNSFAQDGPEGMSNTALSLLHMRSAEPWNVRLACSRASCGQVGSPSEAKDLHDISLVSDIGWVDSFETSIHRGHPPDDQTDRHGSGRFRRVPKGPEGSGNLEGFWTVMPSTSFFLAATPAYHVYYLDAPAVGDTTEAYCSTIYLLIHLSTRLILAMYLLYLFLSVAAEFRNQELPNFLEDLKT